MGRHKSWEQLPQHSVPSQVQATVLASIPGPEPHHQWGVFSQLNPAYHIGSSAERFEALEHQLTHRRALTPQVSWEELHDSKTLHFEVLTGQHLKNTPQSRLELAGRDLAHGKHEKPQTSVTLAVCAKGMSPKG